MVKCGTDAQILGSDIDELAKFYYHKYVLFPLQFDPEAVTYEIRNEIKRIPAEQREGPYQYLGDLDFEYQFAIVSISFQPNHNLDWIKKLSGGTIYLDGFDSSVVFGRGEVSYTITTKWYGGALDEDRIVAEVETKSQRLIKSLTDKNNAIETENAKFLPAIKTIIAQRKERIEADKEKLDSLTQKIKIPLKQKIEGQITKIHISPKEFVRVEKPTPTLPEQYVFDEEKLNPILDFVDFQMKSLERTPGAVKLLGEEQLRDLILSGLNGAFKGDATGETFVKKGKTDIHLKIKKGEILIFECKNWGGEKIYLGTIDQLIGYVTWRQNYGVVIMFCKNKDFSKVLAQIPETIQKHIQYRGGYKKLGESHFVSEHSFPEDRDKVIKIHHLIYNLFSE